MIANVVPNIILATYDAKNGGENRNDNGVTPTIRWPNQENQFDLEHVHERDQQEWPSLIPLAKLCYNTTMSRTTRKTPFYSC